MNRFTRTALALIGFWLFSLLGGLALSLPWFQALKAQGIGAFADGEMVFLRAGGVYLLEAFRLGFGHFSSLPLPTLFLAVCLVFVGLIPISALIVAVVAEAGLGPRGLTTRTLAPLVHFICLRGLTWIVQASVVLFAFAIQQQIAADGLDGRHPDPLSLGVLAVGGALALVVGCMQDVARVALLAPTVPPPLVYLVRICWEVGRKDGLKLLGIWLLLAAPAMAATAFVGAQTPLLIHDQLLWSWGLHQLLLLALVGLKLTWFTAIFAVIGRVQRDFTRAVPAPAERLEGSAVLADPS